MDKVDKDYKQFLTECSEGNLKSVQNILPRLKPHQDKSEGLKLASKKGHADIVSYLLPHMDPVKDYFDPLRLAVDYGHIDTVKVLSPLSNKSDNELSLSLAIMNGDLAITRYLTGQINNDLKNQKRPLSHAAYIGHFDVVGFLLTRKTPPNFANEALCWAVQADNTKMVRLLLPSSDPKDNMSAALRWASRAKNEEILSLLWDLSDPQDALLEAERNEWSADETKLIRDRLKTENVKKNLLTAVAKIKKKENPKKFKI